MRIRFYLFAALLVLSLGVTAWAHTSVTEKQDAVSLEETILEGDPAAAEGIRVGLRTECLDHLFWDTRFVAGPESTVHTDYTYTLNESRPQWERGPYGLQADYWGDSGVTREGETEDERGMEKPFNDVASRCPPDTEDYTERVDLSDYYADFPIYVHSADFLSNNARIYVPAGWGSLEQQVQRELRRCFPISVPEGTYMEVRVDKREDGRVGGYGYSSPDNMAWPEIYSVVTDGGCYFTLSNSGRPGEPKLDASRFPLGYGVYFLPVELEPAAEEIRKSSGDDVMTVRVGALSRVHLIDPGADYAALYANADKSRLYLVTLSGGEYVLTVLDAADGRELDRLTLFSYAETGEGAPRRGDLTAYNETWGVTTVTQESAPPLGDLVVRDDFLLPYLSDGRFAVVTREGDDYGISLTGSFENIFENDLHIAGSRRWYTGLPALDFDGERLAVADLRDFPGACGFFLAVYDRNGPAFLAAYANSLDRSVDRADCEPLEPVPLTVRLP